MSEVKRVYAFGDKKAEGNAGMKNLLGGKGANLAEMNLIGVPVPPGFTITTDVCTEYNELGRDESPRLTSFVPSLYSLYSGREKYRKIYAWVLMCLDFGQKGQRKTCHLSENCTK